MTSILNTIKHMIGPSEGYDYFDTDLIVFINSAFSRLTQLGVGPTAGFSISDDTATWDEFVADQRLAMVREYVYLSVKCSFDTPSNSSLYGSFKERLHELEWLINVGAETPCLKE